HLSVNGNGRNPTHEDLVTVGEGCGIRKRRVLEVIEQVRLAAEQWPVFADVSGVPEDRSREIEKRLNSVGNS
ncbi:type II toxin-antitoxin system HipA family toxin, partial [Ruegeria sp. NA]|nr:type II toxin-antitoxin system HipA family toxin [Ruegeria sp. NA]